MNSVLQGGLSRRLVTGLKVAGRRGPSTPGRCMAVGLPAAAAAAAAAARKAGPPGDRGLGVRPGFVLVCVCLFARVGDDRGQRGAEEFECKDRRGTGWCVHANSALHVA